MVRKSEVMAKTKEKRVEEFLRSLKLFRLEKQIRSLLWRMKNGSRT